MFLGMGPLVDNEWGRKQLDAKDAHGGPADGVVGLEALVATPTNPENSASQCQPVTGHHRQKNHVHGGAATSFFSVVGAVEAAVVLAGCPLRENAGKVGAKKRCQ
jgi:hypothetical protein